MHPTRVLSGILLALCVPPAVAGERPLGGEAVPGFEPVDEAVLAFMDRVGCRAATVAVSIDGRPAYARGYGWRDQGGREPVAPDALMRIASVTKPITAAAVKNAARAGALSLDAPAFDLIGLDPPVGAVADPRLRAITVRHLLEHRGGWDRDATFDPMFRADRIARELGLGRPARPEDVIRSMMARPLQFDPGARRAYSNFGYCVLGRVLEAAAGEPYIDHLRRSVLDPLGIADIRLGRAAVAGRDPREVEYPVPEDAFPLDVMDAHGGLIASAPALCTFLRAYRIDGDPRRAGQRADFTFFGSLPGTTAMIRRRPDGADVAVLFNGRRDRHIDEDCDALKRSIDLALDAARATPPPRP